MGVCEQRPNVAVWLGRTMSLAGRVEAGGASMQVAGWEAGHTSPAVACDHREQTSSLPDGYEYGGRIHSTGTAPVAAATATAATAVPGALTLSPAKVGRLSLSLARSSSIDRATHLAIPSYT